MTDIVERLRVAAKHPYNQHGPCEFLTEAADEIERLRAEVARHVADKDRWQSTQASYIREFN